MMHAAATSTVYVAPPIVWVVGAVVVIYLATAAYLMSYLRRAHPETWVRLGRPSFGFEPNSIVSFSRTFVYLLSGEHRQLKDPKLSGLIWAVRALLVLAIGLMIVVKSSVAPDHRLAPAPAAAGARAPSYSVPPLFFVLLGTVFALVAARRILFGMAPYRLREGHRELWAQLGAADLHLTAREQAGIHADNYRCQCFYTRRFSRHLQVRVS